MSYTSSDRWTCPECGRTEAPDVPLVEQIPAELRGAQERHGREHAGPGTGDDR